MVVTIINVSFIQKIRILDAYLLIHSAVRLVDAEVQRGPWCVLINDLYKNTVQLRT